MRRFTSRLPPDMYSFRIIRGTPIVQAPKNITSCMKRREHGIKIMLARKTKYAKEAKSHLSLQRTFGWRRRERTEISLIKSAFATSESIEDELSKV
jgi:hypothetical protein